MPARGTQPGTAATEDDTSGVLVDGSLEVDRDVHSTMRGLVGRGASSGRFRDAVAELGRELSHGGAMSSRAV